MVRCNTRFRSFAFPRQWHSASRPRLHYARSFYGCVVMVEPFAYLGYCSHSIHSRGTSSQPPASLRLRPPAPTLRRSGRPAPAAGDADVPGVVGPDLHVVVIGPRLELALLLRGGQGPHDAVARRRRRRPLRRAAPSRPHPPARSRQASSGFPAERSGAAPSPPPRRQASETVGARISVAFRAGLVWVTGVGVLPSLRAGACSQVAEWELRVKDKFYTVRAPSALSHLALSSARPSHRPLIPTFTAPPPQRRRFSPTARRPRRPPPSPPSSSTTPSPGRSACQPR